jgi:hypothetical protein
MLKLYLKQKLMVVYGLALDQAESMKDRFVIMDVLGNADAFRTAGPSSTSGERLKYGAAYYPKLETVLSYSFDDEDVKITSYKETMMQELLWML